MADLESAIRIRGCPEPGPRVRIGTRELNHLFRNDA